MATIERRTFTDRAIGVVERVGNRLPNPLVLFASLLTIIAILSAIGSVFGLAVTMPGEDGPQPVKNSCPARASSTCWRTSSTTSWGSPRSARCSRWRWASRWRRAPARWRPRYG
ncbi:MAG: hypothetical protein GEV11_26425 [Streptosporangiales bacterium]|nr:hypothetical protein [Streptosporangiales bacterium]